MKIEVGKTYKVVVRGYGFEVGDVIDVRDDDVDDIERFCVIINRFENKRVFKKALEDMYLNNRLQEFKQYENDEKTEQTAPSKPAHYDTEIDTLAFAKANFSREQVEGFMRINAVKYIQRYKAKNGVDDVRKAVVYLNMLIEHLEEEGKDETKS